MFHPPLHHISVQIFQVPRAFCLSSEVGSRVLEQEECKEVDEIKRKRGRCYFKEDKTRVFSYDSNRRRSLIKGDGIILY